MTRFIRSQFRFRRGRAAALGAAMLVAVVSFLLLSAAAKTTELRVHGSVESNYRTAYDVLVRPKGARLALERSQRLVRNNYLSGLFGGISLSQYHEIKRIRGVDVAAPVANIGYVLLGATAQIPLRPLLTREAFQLYRVRFSTRAHRGTSRYEAGTEYVYYTRRDQIVIRSGLGGGPRELPAGPGGPELDVCHAFVDAYNNANKISPFGTRTFLQCYSARSPELVDSYRAGNRPGDVNAGWSLYFPLLIAAIDPTEEARLLHLDRAIVSGRYFGPHERPRLVPNGRDRRFYFREVPVIASARTYVDENLEARIERLTLLPGTDVPRRLASQSAQAFLTSLHGKSIARRIVSAQTVYRTVLSGALTLAKGRADIGDYWTASPVRYRDAPPDPLRPRRLSNPLSIWRSSNTLLAGGAAGSGPTYSLAPASNADLQFRRLRIHIGSPYFDPYELHGAQVRETPEIHFVGRYDPEKLPGFSPLSQVPLETYYPPILRPADAASRRALHAKPLLPSENLGDYVAQPPLILTTLEGMRPFLKSEAFPGASGRAPISVIRVRVKGVTGTDTLSQERVKAVATEIHDRTGLDVDITAGSSPRRLLVTLPAGKFGRPKLLLEEGWSKKGVSISFLHALDKKRLGLLTLILVSCAFFVGNGAFAAVQARRREIGVLLCVGWSQRAIFSLLFAELLLVGLLAGVVGVAVSLLLAAVLGIELSLARSLLSLPLALLVATSAALLPAWRASRTRPLEAVLPSVVGGHRRRRIRSLAALAATNVRRMPARSLVGIAALAIGVAALTLLIAINQAFQGSLVGTLLGQAISLQVQGLDFLTVGLIVFLASLSLADVLFLSLRERAAEFVTLRTVGWSDLHLARVVAFEALVLGLVGGLAGAALGTTVGAAVGVPVGALALAAFAGVGGGVVVGLLASLIPLMRLQALTPPAVLADE